MNIFRSHCTAPHKFPAVFLAGILPAFLLMLGSQTGQAGSATWNLNPISGDWNTANNWTPAAVPNGPSDTATFGSTNTTGASLSANTEVSDIVFNAGASTFTITVPPALTFTISGTGISNNSVTTQSFVTTVDAPGNRGTINFSASATAGSLTAYLNNGGQGFPVDSGGGGGTQFFDTSTAGNATFTNNGPTAFDNNGASTLFLDNSTAGNGTFINIGGMLDVNQPGGSVYFFGTSNAGNGTFFQNGGGVNGAAGGFLVFRDSSKASNGTFIGLPGTASSASGGFILFDDTSTAGNGIFTNNGADVNDAGSARVAFNDSSSADNGTFTNHAGVNDALNSGYITFADSSTARNGTFTNIGGAVFGRFGGNISFSNTSTADNGTFSNNGGTVINALGGVTSFLDTSTASNGIFTTNGGAVSGADGGLVAFSNTSTAGNATFTNNGGAVSDALNGRTTFADSSTAGNATFTNSGGSTDFYNTATASNATLIAAEGSAYSGSISFFDDSDGGTARVQLTGNSILYISFHNPPGVTTGSIEGTGFVYIGPNNLTVGGNNLSTTFSGTIADSGLGGSLTKIGNGTLTLSGVNSFAGGTAISAGGLTAASDGSLGSGSISLQVAGVILTLESGATNDYINDAASLSIVSGASVNLNFEGSPDQVDALLIDGKLQIAGVYGSAQSNATYKLPQFAGSGTLLVGDATPTPTPTPSLLNISTRMQVLTGDNVLIGGFIITGNAPKKVILRAIGPSLIAFGLADALADPVLELHMPDMTVVTNDNWKDTQQTEIEATGLQPSEDLESAIVATLAPGAYTAIVSGKNGGTGVGLVEAYDLDEAADSTLANISTRGFVDTGDNVMIGGVIIGGGSSQVLVRAIGPALAAFGVSGALEDTVLELHDKDGALITTNDDWKDTQQSQIEAIGLPPTDDRESAILATLTPDSYTAIVRGKNDTTGVALVEVYNITLP